MQHHVAKSIRIGDDDKEKSLGCANAPFLRLSIPSLFYHSFKHIYFLNHHAIHVSIDFRFRWRAEQIGQAIVWLFLVQEKEMAPFGIRKF